MKIKRTNTNFINVIFAVLTVQYLAFYYVEIGSFPRVVLFVFYGAAILLPVILSFSVRINWSSFRLLSLLIYVYIFINGFFFINRSYSTVFADYVIYLAIISGFLLSSYEAKVFIKPFKIISWLGIVLFCYILTVEQIDFSLALERGYTWTEIFYYGPLFWAIIPAVILSVLYERNLILSLCYWGVAVILNLLFLKRFILIDSIVLLLAVMFINFHKEEKLIGNFRFFLIAGVLVGGVLYFSSGSLTSLFEATNERILESSDDLSTFNRFVESKVHFSNTPFTEIFTGHGFAGTHYGLGKEASALHFGWANFLFKGGILLLSVILMVYFKAFRLIFNFSRLPLDMKFPVIILMISSIRLVYLNMHSMTPELMMFFYSLFRISDYNKGSALNSKGGI